MIIKYNADDLCVAIVAQGLHDLKKEHRKLKHLKSERDRNAQQGKINKLKKELQTEWFKSLTNLDVEVLIEGVLNDNKRVSKSNKKI